MRIYFLIFLFLLFGCSCSGKIKTEEDILKKITRDYIKTYSHRFGRTIAMEEMLDNIHIIVEEDTAKIDGVRLFYIFYGNSFSYNNIEKLSRIWEEGKYYVLFYSFEGPYLSKYDVPKELQRAIKNPFIEEDIEWIVVICEKNKKYQVITEIYNMPLKYIDELNNFSCE
jgi:hypothetical protein